MMPEYVVMNPSGNITILVSTPVPEEERPGVALELMKAEPAAEQLGFLYDEDGYDIALCMAGGEFCGNASMSAAAYALKRSGRSEGRLKLKVSGSAEPVYVDIREEGEALWYGSVSMPEVLSVKEIMLPDGATHPLVRLPGISHIIIEEEPPAKEEAEEKIRSYCEYLDCEALGFIYFNKAEMRITPLVYVPAAGTLCWENACGSGSCAVGAYMLSKYGISGEIELKQPGGSIGVRSLPGVAPVISGRVEQVY